jgi:uncharacterized protein (DUF2461 family)
MAIAGLTRAMHAAIVRPPRFSSLYLYEEMKLKGKPVGIRRCPAAVCGNDLRHRHWVSNLGSGEQ